MGGVNAVPITPFEEVKLEYVKYQYPTRPAITMMAEVAQIEIAVSKGFPRVHLQKLRNDWLSVVGYGPSLRETWDKITRPCITTSGAHDFLIERGFVPDFHTQCDGRGHQAEFLKKPHKDVTYLMASICSPKVWNRLEGHKVFLWHRCNGEHVVEWVGKHDDGGLLIAGGSNIGLSAIHLGGILGFRKFKLFGMDCNYRGKSRHAGKHPDPVPQKRIEAGRWVTSPQMVNACSEFISLIKNPDLKFEVFGTSLLTDTIEKEGLSE